MEDRDDEVDGRWIGAVCEYASTCDGSCAELTSHSDLHMDDLTQLGYCDSCLPLMPKDIQERISRSEADSHEA